MKSNHSPPTLFRLRFCHPNQPWHRRRLLAEIPLTQFWAFFPACSKSLDSFLRRRDLCRRRPHRSLLLRKESKDLLQAGKKVNITRLNHLISSLVMFSLRGVPKCVHLPVQNLGVLSVNRCGCPARIQFLMYGK